ncbi:putative phosphoketolase [Rhodotorula diobovata]|uniref:Putative phosphoketolase n=1 Tax=Rhodotorula diobovata TaxID=5288 RepID=A0A5C5FV56_9BASI|nr:putative phosphoketolase [Rhodotorula diobovata]
MADHPDAPPPPITPSLYAEKPDATLSSLTVELDVDSAVAKYPAKHLEAVAANWRLSNYLAMAQIFLQKNGRVQRKLEVGDIKPRLLGHAGTTGGLSLAYVHSQALIRRKGEEEGAEPKMLFVTGPGHGAPAILSNLYIEGAITKFYPQYSLDEDGLEKFIKYFSWPGGFPSHVNAETPGCIHEGGELGYALAAAYGSVMDRPEQISVVVVGDGESETGPTATAWHSHKWLDPAESGAVLPILHVNGFKISERTLPGTMDNIELSLLYSGYGYQVRFVEYKAQGNATMGGNDAADHAIHADMAASMDWAYGEIRKIQKAARSGGKPIEKPRWPMIILRSPKGWTGPASEHGKQLLNNFASHQVPLPDVRTDSGALEYLDKWLHSYDSEKFFDFSEANLKRGTIFAPLLDEALPKDNERRLGFIKESYNAYKPLDLADWKGFGYEKDEDVSCMKAIGKYLTDVVKRNPKSFRMFSPDELASNKLDAVLDATTRCFQPDPTTAHIGGRVTEMLSEHTLQGWLQGYTMTGRHGVFPSYEAFLGIVATMMVQYTKFLKMGLECSWRGDEHNGFSHQQPGFVSTVLSLPPQLARVYFPADANTSVSVIAHCLRSKNYINLIVGTKAPSPVYLSIEEAERHCVAGASIWENYSVDKGVDPDIVLVGIGFELTQEVIHAAGILRKDFGTSLRVRVVNVVDLMILSGEGEHPHALDEAGFNSLFPPGTPVAINFHGYVGQVSSLLFNRAHSVGRSRFTIHGYKEVGSTTTPFMMLALNECDRFTLAQDALRMVTHNYTRLDNIKGDEKRHRVGTVVARANEMIAHYKHQLRLMERHAYETQEDHPDIGAVPTLAEQ